MPAEEPGRYAYDGLDRVIHERARLGVLTSLVGHPKGLAFADLRRLCDLTDGNLSRHIATLQEAGFVEVSKGFENNRPQTLVRITDEGRRRYLDYLAVLEQVVRDAAEAARTALPGHPVLKGAGA
ncbi:MAG TPA: transcriptional regulator [Caulobacteraceae bacterium]|nr:transcriptional regulator [Caulobacteraceae bacterium]